MNEEELFQEEIQKLINYVEENLRTTDETQVEFLDPRQFKPRLINKQNQVVFGRRGSGKSLLLKTLNKDNEDYIYIKSNLEDYKDTSFPNSILHVLIEFLIGIVEFLENIQFGFFQFKLKYRRHLLIKKINEKIEEYKNQIKIPDLYDEEIREKANSSINGEVEANKGIAKVKMGGSYNTEKESHKSFLREKLNLLKNEIPELKSLLKEISKFKQKTSIFLGLDDFYFIRKQEQPFFIDFFHRLTKDTKLYIKVGTIRYRSKLYTTSKESYIGTELGHDIQEIDLDYTLDRFDLMQTFLKELLDEAILNSKSDLKISNLFSENGLKQLCLASGGVPRDFLSLFIKLRNYVGYNKTISKIDVTEVAINNFKNKTDAFAKDSAEEKEVLENYLNYLKNFLLEIKRTNIFLISNPDLENFPQISQAIKELTDLRMIHLVEPITSSAPSDGKKYSAYMIDIGLYANSKPRNFEQIEPGISDDRSRKDKIRAAPRIKLPEFDEYIKNINNQQVLELSN